MFASITDEEVKEFTDKLDNENTKMKTLYDMKVFLKNILTPVTRKGKLKISRPWNCKFVLAVRKKNGEEYELSSLRAFIQSIDRHLR